MNEVRLYLIAILRFCKGVDCKMTKDNAEFRDNIETGLSFLSETVDALVVLSDCLGEGFQYPEKFEEWRAIAFTHRLPRFLSLCNVIERDVRRLLTEMDEAVERTYEEQRKETA